MLVVCCLLLVACVCVRLFVCWLFVVGCNLLFVIVLCSLLCVRCYVPFVLCSLLCIILYLLVVLCSMLLFRIAYYLLFVVCCLMFVVRCLMFVVNGLRFNVCCLLLVDC